jgi:hypothetical protein
VFADGPFYAALVASLGGVSWLRGAAFFALVTLVAAFVPSAHGVTIAGTRSWSLAAAGYPPIVIHPGQATSSKRSATITLPDGAVQGGKTWYRIHLHYRLALDPQSPSGHIYVEASTDGWPCAMVRFDVTRANGTAHVKMVASGLVDGVQAKTVALVHEGTFENFLEYRGVRSGRNTVAFTAERYGPARFRSLTIYSDTRIVRSSAALPELTLEPFAPRRVTAGVPFLLGFRVRNTGGIRTLSGHVDLIPGSGLKQLRAGTFPALPTGALTTGSLHLVAPHAGDYQLTIAAQGGNASQAATLALTRQVTITEPQPQPVSTKRWLLSAAMYGCLMLAIAVGGLPGWAAAVGVVVLWVALGFAVRSYAAIAFVLVIPLWDAVRGTTSGDLGQVWALDLVILGPLGAAFVAAGVFVGRRRRSRITPARSSSSSCRRARNPY